MKNIIMFVVTAVICLALGALGFSLFAPKPAAPEQAACTPDLSCEKEKESLTNALIVERNHVEKLQFRVAGVNEDKAWQTAGAMKDSPNDIAYIKTIASTSIEVDPVFWLAHDGNPGCTSGDDFIVGTPKCNPNGYLVVNESTSTKTYTLSSKIKITSNTLGADGITPKEISLTDFIQALDSGKLKKEDYLFHVVLKDKQVVELSEQYRP